MRFNTKKKREKLASEIEKYLIMQGFMYNNSAKEITDNWVEHGINSFKSQITKDAIKIATYNYIYNLKGKNK